MLFVTPDQQCQSSEGSIHTKEAEANYPTRRETECCTILITIQAEHTLLSHKDTDWNTVLWELTFSILCAHYNCNPDLILVLQQNRLRWCGHVLRKEDTDWVKKLWNMRRRAPDQHVGQRGRGKRLCEKIANDIIWTGRLLWIIVDGRSW